LNSKEIILAALRFEAAPRIPVILLSSGIWEYARNNMTIDDFINLPPEKNSEFVINTNKILNMDVIWTAAGCNNLVLKALGADTTFNKPGSSSDVNSPLLNTPDDIDRLDISLIENSREIHNLLKATRIIAQEAGSEYLVGVSQWGPFTLAGLLYGMEVFMKICMKDTVAAQHILQNSSKFAVKYLSLFADAGAELICQSEPMSSGDLISPRMFKNLAVPFLKGNNQAISNKVIARMTHICGNTSRILDDINEIDTDIFSVDYKVDLETAKAKLKGKTALAGNIDPVRIMMEGSAAEVKYEAQECCRRASKGGGYVLMPGCDIPVSTPLENISAMVEVAYREVYI
jgi:uroporphyrinogen decarboxylase